MQRDPAGLLLDIEGALSPLIAAQGGVLDVVSGLDEGLDLLKTTPRKWRVVLMTDGYGPHPQAIEGMATVKFTTIVNQKTSLERDRGKAFYRAHVNGKPSFLSK